MKYEIFSDPARVYGKMLADIKRAKGEILLETYIYSNDKVGFEFRDALVKKALEGVEVRLLVDAWGSNVNRAFFKKLIAAGGEVRFFRKLRYAIRIFSANHERNHRKLLLIDGKVSYIGSMNITASCLGWRELMLRVEGSMTEAFRRSFNKTWKRFGLFSIHDMRRIVYEDFEILQDAPLGRYDLTERRYRKLIKSAKKEILIETPYLVPPMRIRKAFRRAVKRGVKVKIVIPRRSDVLAVDIFRNRYLGRLHRAGVEIYYYPKKLHSKLLIVDEGSFLMGSSNLDFRSFRHQYEINLFGKNKEIISVLKKHFVFNLRKTKRFDYGVWQERHLLSRIGEFLMRPFEKYF